MCLASSPPPPNRRPSSAPPPPPSLPLFPSSHLWQHADPDYSAAYVIIETSSKEEGHGLAFTLGRGTELLVMAVKSLQPYIVGLTLGSIYSDFAGFWRRITSESQLRWVGAGAARQARAAAVLPTHSHSLFVAARPTHAPNNPDSCPSGRSGPRRA